MLESSKSWFTITAPLAPAYSAPGFNSSKVTEVIGGESVNILDKKKDWLFVEQDDGYKSWIKDFYGNFCDEPYAATHIVIESGELPFGTRVKKNKNIIIMSDGKSRTIGQKIKNIFGIAEPNQILPLAKGLLGSPYRWGGKTSFGFDCSGFVQMVCLAAGMSVPRDSMLQRDFLKDYSIDSNAAKPGDLHFFGINGVVKHVGLSTGGKGLIHCQGSVKEETIESDMGSKSNERLADIYMSTHSIRRKFCP